MPWLSRGSSVELVVVSGRCDSFVGSLVVASGRFVAAVPAPIDDCVVVGFGLDDLRQLVRLWYLQQRATVVGGYVVDDSGRYRRVIFSKSHCLAVSCTACSRSRICRCWVRHRSVGYRSWAAWLVRAYAGDCDCVRASDPGYACPFPWVGIPPLCCGDVDASVAA